MIAQSGTYMYKTAQFVSEYSKPLYKNNFIIKYTKDFAQLKRKQSSLKKMSITYLMMPISYL